MKSSLGLIIVVASINLSHGWIKVILPESNNTRVVEETGAITYSTPPYDGALGRLVVANPVNACTPLASVPYPSNDKFSWFLLARRYGCTFYAKLSNAQKAGYAGVIIYDSEETDQVFSHFARPFGLGDLSVYAVLVSKSDGHFLRQCTYDRGFVLEWYPSDDFTLFSYLIPCIGIILFCILMIAFLVVAQHCTRRYRERRRNARFRLAKKYLKQLPVKKWTKRCAELEKYETCSICLDDYQEGDKLRILPCLHAYHATKCIDIWLTKNRRICPLCKRKIVLPGMPEDPSDDETAPLLDTHHTTNGGTFEERPSTWNTTNRVEVEIETVDEQPGSSTAVAPGGLFSLNDEVEVLPSRRKHKKKKKSRRNRDAAVLDDVNVAGPSSSNLTNENQMIVVTEMGSDDEQPLLV